jgi:hypothetical protein
MKFNIARLLCLALLTLPLPALASDPNIGIAAKAPAGFGPVQAIYCPDANGKLQVCSFSGGGPPTGSAGGPNHPDRWRALVRRADWHDRCFEGRWANS